MSVPLGRFAGERFFFWDGSQSLCKLQEWRSNGIRCRDFSNRLVGLERSRGHAGEERADPSFQFGSWIRQTTGRDEPRSPGDADHSLASVASLRLAWTPLFRGFCILSAQGLVGARRRNGNVLFRGECIRGRIGKRLPVGVRLSARGESRFCCHPPISPRSAANATKGSLRGTVPAKMES